ncbi:MAG: hypothetical protein U1B83_08780 [Candidatus Cloacimonadaceae bacterium]|nr:hypothetical protein [Candidatus Cloacimonadaceae bacterium]
MTERPEVVKAIAIAREFGDLSENAEYKAARERQRAIDSEIGFEPITAMAMVLLRKML